MNNSQEADKLWQQIYASTNAPRGMVLAYVKALSKEAEILPPKERHAQAINGWDKNSSTRGDEIISSIIKVLAMQDWLDDSSSDELNSVLALASQLELHISNEALWQEFFTKVRATM